jgi:hypothetical protein
LIDVAGYIDRIELERIRLVVLNSKLRANLDVLQLAQKPANMD